MAAVFSGLDGSNQQVETRDGPVPHPAGPYVAEAAQTTLTDYSKSILHRRPNNASRWLATVTICPESLLKIWQLRLQVQAWPEPLVLKPLTPERRSAKLQAS